MPNMTPEVHLLLASFGYPKLRLMTRTQMVKINRARAETHSRAAAREPDERRRMWRFKLRNNAVRRAESWS